MTDVYYVDFKKKELLNQKKIKTSISKLSNEKLNYFSELIDRGLTQVLVNSRIDNVSLPQNLIGNIGTPINWSHKFKLNDFIYDDEAISGTLSFNKNPFFVFLPWESIWLISRPDEGSKSVKIWSKGISNNMLSEMKHKMQHLGLS